MLSHNPNIVITNNSSIENAVGLWGNIVEDACVINVEDNVITVNQDAMC